MPLHSLPVWMSISFISPSVKNCPLLRYWVRFYSIAVLWPWQLYISLNIGDESLWLMCESSIIFPKTIICRWEGTHLAWMLLWSFLIGGACWRFSQWRKGGSWEDHRGSLDPQMRSPSICRHRCLHRTLGHIETLQHLHPCQPNQHLHPSTPIIPVQHLLGDRLPALSLPLHPMGSLLHPHVKYVSSFMEILSVFFSSYLYLVPYWHVFSLHDWVVSL